MKHQVGYIIYVKIIDTFLEDDISPHCCSLTQTFIGETFKMDALSCHFYSLVGDYSQQLCPLSEMKEKRRADLDLLFKSHSHKKYIGVFDVHLETILSLQYIF